MNDDLLYFNGLNVSTGEYLTPPLRAEEVVQAARGETFAPDHLQELVRRTKSDAPHYGVKEGVDADNLAEAGWGVIFAQDADPALRDALRELLEHRKAQANQIKERYREYTYRPNESKNLFLARQGVGPGAVDPDKVPYYLLIVGDPEKIPYTFQYQLDVAYAVGRIQFDTVDEYSQYAQSVVRAERENVGRDKRAAFFGVANPDDPNTQLSVEHLVQPLAEKIGAEESGWVVDAYVAQDATKARLEGLLQEDTPAFLFTASHGAGFELGDPRQTKQQGALICQDWQGPNAMRGKPVPQSMYYAADDVMSNANIHGMVAFHFSCYGAGTPRYDEFSHVRQGARDRIQIAPSSFLARLPKKLLAHPKGGALAVIGHIDRAWGSSFLWNKSVPQLATYESALKRLLRGSTVGAAMEYFNNRYAELAASLSSSLEDLKYSKAVDATELATLWTANNDARGYAIIGDPAVRLRVREPKLETLTVPGTLSIAPDSAEVSPNQTSLDSTLEKLEQQLVGLVQTVRELRSGLQDQNPNSRRSL